MEALTNRRNLLIAAACVAALGAAEVLKPRKQISLLGKRKLADVIPNELPQWTAHDVSDLVQPRQEGSLASRLYEQTVGRVYIDKADGFQVMMLAAYGETQSRDLQLHRPESCYPAVGFRITSDSLAETPIGPTALLPTRKLIAEAPGRQEIIMYWARLGEYIPVGGLQQRIDVLKTAMSGYFADGLLLRVSAVGAEPAQVFPRLEKFIAALVTGTPSAGRPVLIGTRLSKAVG